VKKNIDEQVKNKINIDYKNNIISCLVRSRSKLQIGHLLCRISRKYIVNKTTEEQK